MKKSKLFLVLLLLVPVFLLGQEISAALISVESNNLIIEQLASQLGFTASPFLGVFLTSLASHFHLGNEFIQESEVFSSTLVLVLSGLLVIAAPLSGALTDFAPPLKALHGALIGPVQSNSAGAIFVLANIGSYANQNLSNETDITIAGISFPFALIFTLFVALSYFIMISAVSTLIDFLVLVIPVPLIDTILIAIKYIITTGLVSIAIFYPGLAVIVLAIMYVIAYLLFKRAKRISIKQRLLIIDPIYSRSWIFKRWTLQSQAQRRELGESIFPIFLTSKTKPFKRHRRIFICFNNGEFKLIQPGTLFSKQVSSPVAIDSIHTTLTRVNLFLGETEIGFTSLNYRKALKDIINHEVTSEDTTDIKRLILNG